MDTEAPTHAEIQALFYRLAGIPRTAGTPELWDAAAEIAKDYVRREPKQDSERSPEDLFADRMVEAMDQGYSHKQAMEIAAQPTTELERAADELYDTVRTELFRTEFRRIYARLTEHRTLDYYDPARQNLISEHDCTFEDGQWWFGHGMPCKHPALHTA